MRVPDALAQELRRAVPQNDERTEEKDRAMKTSKMPKKKTTTTAKANAKRGTTKAKVTKATKHAKKTTFEKVGAALASTASFAASVARGTEDRIRDLASAVTSHPDTDPAPRATDLLISHHRKVEKLLDGVESANGNTASLLREVADNLVAHISIEEELFYPAVRKLDRDIILEGLEEHAMGRFALKRLLSTRSTDESLKARLKALQELMVNHHKEEEDDLFPKVKKAMSNDELRALGTKMKVLFDADVKRGYEAVLATFHDLAPTPVRSTPAKNPAKKPSGGPRKRAAEAS